MVWPAITFDPNDPSTDGTASTVYVFLRETPGDFYRSGDGMVSVPIQTEPRFLVGNPAVVFEDDYYLGVQGGPNYDISPDGERFLMIRQVEEATMAATQIVVVENWLEELKRLVPTE